MRLTRNYRPALAHACGERCVNDHNDLLVPFSLNWADSLEGVVRSIGGRVLRGLMWSPQMWAARLA